MTPPTDPMLYTVYHYVYLIIYLLVKKKCCHLEFVYMYMQLLMKSILFDYKRYIGDGALLEQKHGGDTG